MCDGVQIFFHRLQRALSDCCRGSHQIELRGEAGCSCDNKFAVSVIFLLRSPDLVGFQRGESRSETPRSKNSLDSYSEWWGGMNVGEWLIQKKFLCRLAGWLAAVVASIGPASSSSYKGMYESRHPTYTWNTAADTDQVNPYFWPLRSYLVVGVKHPGLSWISSLVNFHILRTAPAILIFWIRGVCEVICFVFLRGIRLRFGIVCEFLFH